MDWQQLPNESLYLFGKSNGTKMNIIFCVSVTPAKVAEPAKDAQDVSTRRDLANTCDVLRCMYTRTTTRAYKHACCRETEVADPIGLRKY